MSTSVVINRNNKNVISMADMKPGDIGEITQCLDNERYIGHIVMRTLSYGDDVEVIDMSLFPESGRCWTNIHQSGAKNIMVKVYPNAKITIDLNGE